MRSLLTFAVLIAGAVASAEDLTGITLTPRYGVTPAPEFYPQGTPKETLATVAKLLEKGRYSYLLAHVADPQFVDAEVAERARRLEPAVEKQLAAVRAEQKRGLAPDTPSSRIIPADPVGFAEKVREEAERQAFDALVRAMQDNLSEFPEHVAQVNSIAAEGTLTENGPTATAEAKSVPGKKLYLTQVGVPALRDVRVLENNIPVTRQDPITITRWFVQDRQKD